MRWVRRLALLGAALGIGVVVARSRKGPAFDPARPRHDWGTMPLAIDGEPAE